MLYRSRRIEGPGTGVDAGAGKGVGASAGGLHSQETRELLSDSGDSDE